MKSILIVPILLFIFCFACKNQTDLKSSDDSFTEPEFKRFFSDESFWNQPIGENPEIDPDNEKWIKMLEQEPTGENFSTVFRKWTIPVYEADASTEYVNVELHRLDDEEIKTWVTVQERTHFGHGPGFNPVPIPEGAKPDLEDDAHFCVVDWNRMLAWDMWGLKQREDGKWESKTGMMFRLDGDGVFNADELGYVDDESVHFHGPSRAAGVPAAAGLVRYDEVMNGKIEHKLSCATRFAAAQVHVYPASWTDGYVEGGIPEGAVIQLDPNLDLSLFELTSEELVIAKALQEYGMVIVDIAQGQPLYVEGLWGQPDKSWEGKLSEWEDKGINSIPYKHYRVLKVENPINRGDIRTSWASHKDVWLPKSIKLN